MKVLQTYRNSNAMGVLLLLCQFLCFTLSQGQSQNSNGYALTPNTIIDYRNHEEGRVLEEQFDFDFSAIEDPDNSTIFSDDVFVGTQSEELPDNATGSTDNEPDSNSNEKPTGLPVSGSSIPLEPNEDPEDLSVSESTIPLEEIEDVLSASIDVMTTLHLELVDTPSLMHQGQVVAFLEITLGFLSFYLFKGIFMPMKIESEGIEVEFIRQTRSSAGQFTQPDESVQPRNDGIPKPLYVHLQVTGKIYEEDIEDGNLKFDQAVRKIIAEKEGEYIESLKFVDGDFFYALNKASIFLGQETNQDETVRSSDEEDQNPLDILYEDPEPADSMQETKSTTSGNDEIQGDVLSLGAIIGIAISAVVLLVVIVVFIYRARVRRNGRNAKGSGRKMLSPRKKKRWDQRNGLEGPVDSMANENLLMSDQIPSDKKSDVASIDDLESQAMYSYNQNSSGSVYTNGSNVKLFSNHSYNYGSDTSYAFSLEPGIEASIVEGVVASDRSGFSNGSDVPIREIPQVRMMTNEKSGGVDHSKITNQDKKEEYMMCDHFGNTQIEREPSELKLTKSELEMLPSNLRGSSYESESKLVLQKILAPAGKLGIVIDTSIEGPVVHSVNKGSQLSGKIFPGDIIVAIDEVDTRAMSSSAITAVMVKTANEKRNLTVRRMA